jgi:hypothetical protein
MRGDVGKGHDVGAEGKTKLQTSLDFEEAMKGTKLTRAEERIRLNT